MIFFIEVKVRAMSLCRRCVNRYGEASALRIVLDITKSDNKVILNLKHSNGS
jgi:hypothetical protein